MEMNEEFKKIEEKHKKLIEKAIAMMKEVEEKDPKHAMSHMEAVVGYTKEILQEMPNADKEVCIISSYWHDVGRKVQEKGHAKISADLLQKEMKHLGYEEEMINKCYQAIEKHSWKEIPETIEGMIIRDADKIDFVGIGRWKQCIETNCRFHKILELLPNMRKELLKLEPSREIFDREIGKLVIYLHDKIFLS